MTNIRRYYRNNDIVFTTHVTYARQPFLLESFDDLWGSIQKYFHPNILAWVVISDHLHLLTENKGENLSEMMKKMKLSFSTKYRTRNNLKSGRIWQYRFYDHVIRNQIDLIRHLDYIHYNPVKHGLINDPFEWDYSSIRKYKEYYPENWGKRKEIEFEDTFGE